MKVEYIQYISLPVYKECIPDPKLSGLNGGKATFDKL